MFDPTVYENLRVVLEGAVYDLDLAGTILVTDREDWVNLAVMSRMYRITFQLIDSPEESNQDGTMLDVTDIAAEMTLSAELSDLASEILELEGKPPGCSLDISFRLQMQPMVEKCSEITTVLKRVWGERFVIRQTLSYEYGADPHSPENRIQVLLGRRFDEELVDDIPRLVDHAVLSLQELARINRASSWA